MVGHLPNILRERVWAQSCYFSSFFETTKLYQCMQSCKLLQLAETWVATGLVKFMPGFLIFMVIPVFIDNGLIVWTLECKLKWRRVGSSVFRLNWLVLSSDVYGLHNPNVRIVNLILLWFFKIAIPNSISVFLTKRKDTQLLDDVAC